MVLGSALVENGKLFAASRFFSRLLFIKVGKTALFR